HPAVDLAGVSTVGPDPERRAAVAVGLLAGAGVDLGAVTVVAGAAGPTLAADAEAAGNSPSVAPAGHAGEAHGGAADVVDAVASSGAEALLAIGPLTNVAAMTTAGVPPAELPI